MEVLPVAPDRILWADASKQRDILDEQAGTTVSDGVLRIRSTQNGALQTLFSRAFFASDVGDGSQWRTILGSTDAYEEPASQIGSAPSPVQARSRGGYGYRAPMEEIGGLATIAFAAAAIAEMHRGIALPMAVIVFGATLLIRWMAPIPCGTRISECDGTLYIGIGGNFPSQFHGSSTILFIGGVAGMELGFLALFGIAPEALTSISTIVFGTALFLTGNAARQVSKLNPTSSLEAAPSASMAILAGQVASGAASVQVVAGLTAMVLGSLDVAGVNRGILTLAALAVLGRAVILTGSVLIGMAPSIGSLFLRFLSRG